MSDTICKRCSCIVGRSKLKNGECVNIEQCMKMIKYQKEEKEEDYQRKKLLNMHYFDKYRYKQRGSIRPTDRSRSQEDC